MSQPPETATTPSGLPGPGTLPPGADAGVIHDIGYRHHDGPRLGRPAIRRALYLESAKAAYGIGRTARSKILPFLLLGAMCLPAVIIVVVTTATGARQLVAEYTAYAFSAQLVIAIYVAGQAPASVSRDLRFRVTSLYFARPMERVDYVVAKLAALTTGVFVLIALPLTILLVGALLARLPLSEQVPDYLRALAGAALLSVLLAGIGLVIASVTPRRGLGVAAVIAVLLILTGVQGMAQGISMDLGHDTAASWFGLLSPFGMVAGVQSALLGADDNLFAVPTDVSQGLVFAAVTGVVIVTCYRLLLVRYRRVGVA